ncbi:MAG: hypothetical protein ACLUKQ_12330, partial [Peptococcaceae bacterium]
RMETTEYAPAESWYGWKVYWSDGLGSLIFRGVTLEEFLYRCVVDGKAGLSFFLLAALLDSGFACVP